jgi:hypothetical protein
MLPEHHTLDTYRSRDWTQYEMGMGDHILLHNPVILFEKCNTYAQITFIINNN